MRIHQPGVSMTILMKLGGYEKKKFDTSEGVKLNFEQVLGSKDAQDLPINAPGTIKRHMSSENILSQTSQNKHPKIHTTPNHTKKSSTAITATAKKEKRITERNFKEDEIQKSKEIFSTPAPNREFLLQRSSKENQICLKKKMIRPKRKKRRIIKLKNPHEKCFVYDLIDDSKLNLPLRVQLKKNDDDFDTDEDQCQRSAYYCLREVEEAYSKLLKTKKLI